MGDLPADVRMVALDFDGVLTDDRVFVHQDGTESVVCSRADGLGIALLRKAGIPVVIISTETNPVVKVRADKLGVPVYQALEDKAAALEWIVHKQGLRLADVVFVGNDVNDLECLRRVGCAAAPADAHPSVLEIADIVLEKPGGRGAVRELADRILLDRRFLARAGDGEGVAVPSAAGQSGARKQEHCSQSSGTPVAVS